MIARWWRRVFPPHEQIRAAAEERYGEHDEIAAELTALAPEVDRIARVLDRSPDPITARVRGTARRRRQAPQGGS